MTLTTLFSTTDMGENCGSNNSAEVPGPLGLRELVVLCCVLTLSCCCCGFCFVLGKRKGYREYERAHLLWQRVSRYSTRATVEMSALPSSGINSDVITVVPPSVRDINDDVKYQRDFADAQENSISMSIPGAIKKRPAFKSLSAYPRPTIDRKLLQPSPQQTRAYEEEEAAARNVSVYDQVEGLSEETPGDRVFASGREDALYSQPIASGHTPHTEGSGAGQLLERTPSMPMPTVADLKKASKSSKASSSRMESMETLSDARDSDLYKAVIPNSEAHALCGVRRAPSDGKDLDILSMALGIEPIVEAQLDASDSSKSKVGEHWHEEEHGEESGDECDGRSDLQSAKSLSAEHQNMLYGSSEVVQTTRTSASQRSHSGSSSSSSARDMLFVEAQTRTAHSVEETSGAAAAGQ